MSPIVLDPVALATDQWIFDPADEDSGAELVLGPGTAYIVTGFDAPAPPAKFALSGSLDTEGDRIADRGHDNRRVSITVKTYDTTQPGLDAKIALLEAKAGKLFRKGGTFRRVRPNDDYRTVDVLAADAYEPTFDVIYFARNIAEVTIGFVGEPYARGPETTIALTASTTSAAVVTTFTADDPVPGDVDATAELELSNGTTVETWSRAFWGIDQDTTSDVFWEAEDQTIVNGTATADADASGAFNVTYTPGGAGTHDIITLSGDQVGNYRLFARAIFSSANYLQVAWSPRDGGLVTTNPAAVGIAGTDYCIFDLGLITGIWPTGNPYGGWDATIQYVTPAGTGSLQLDCVWVVPVDLGYGEFFSSSARTSFVVTGSEAWGTVITGSNTFRYRPDSYEGSYLRVPPSGEEGDALRIVAKTSRGDAAGGSDTNIDATQATLTVVPRYLTVF